MAAPGKLPYTTHMETVVRDVDAMDNGERTAAERLVGHSLRDRQQLVIQVIDLADGLNESPSDADEDGLPEWCDIYAGLTDQEIETLERAISWRLDLTRPIPEAVE